MMLMQRTPDTMAGAIELEPANFGNMAAGSAGFRGRMQAGRAWRLND
jgi:hypothetical protein